MRRIETSSVAALSEPVSPLSRPPGAVPDPAGILAAFRDIVARLRKQRPAVAPEVQSPFPSDLSEDARWERLAVVAD
eukprot:3924120-Alexandrium_andersonii.AAC.1